MDKYSIVIYYMYIQSKQLIKTSKGNVMLGVLNHLNMFIQK